MRYRLLGRTGLRISEVFLGTRSFGASGRGGGPGGDSDGGSGGGSSGWGGGGRGAATSPEECRRIFDLYAEAGGNVLDAPFNHRDGRTRRS